ncbi:site-specific integrase [Nannocystis pusilla]|uniref:Tyrosine-type recombinase/integrase n=1 Tax=Nannocystis pusilla TaxID=889268 RepID=A0ABS7U2Y8_9BACT|nr:site-specific integrase [Nannocystis pusilla]MBZ5714900.1 tyrosine-type recombinase/integrase [Nannocystis pusilla]
MLTNTQAREAKPREVKYEITCDSLPGFVLRVLPSGKKVFFARYRDPANKDHRHRLGLLTPAFGADEARKIAMVVLAQQGPGASVGAPKAAGPTSETALSSGSKAPTIREFARRFEQDHVDMYLKPRTAEKYRRVLRLYVLPEFGSKRMDDITPADVQRAHNKLKPMPCAANYMRCVLSVMYSKWELWDRTAYRNPATAVQRFEEREVERFLTPEERQALERVLTAAEKIRSGKPGHIGREAIWGVRLLMLTGMRRDEIRDLRWEQVAWRQKMLRLPDSKGGKRDVIVADEVMALLGAIAAAKGNPKRGLVVCSKNGKKLYSLDRSWANARKLAGIPDVRLHDLRHSVASDAIMNGVPLEVVGKMLGHKNYRTTQRYAHIADYVLRDAVNLTSKVIVRAGRSGAKAKPPKGSPTRPRSR